jgi:hypothetical protein
MRRTISIAPSQNSKDKTCEFNTDRQARHETRSSPNTDETTPDGNKLSRGLPTHQKDERKAFVARSARQKKKSRNTVVRAKSAYPTRRRAMTSLELAGIMPHHLKRPRHSGTYWMWEIER